MTKFRRRAAPPGEGHPAKPLQHADGGTDRPETPALEGREPLPQELTGRASGTDDNLVSLFDSTSPEHLADGFRGGSQDVPDQPDGSPGLRPDPTEQLPD